MSSGICKNEKEEREEKRENKNTFKFWIYMAFIILGLLLIIIIIVIIYSLLSNHQINTTTKQIANPPSLPLFNTTSLSSVQNLPPSKVSTTNISIPHPTEVKKPFLSTLMSDTNEKTNQVLTTIGKTTSNTIQPLLNRKIPVNKTGGFRCMNRRRI